MNFLTIITSLAAITWLAQSPAHAAAPTPESEAISLVDKGAEALRENRIRDARRLFEAALVKEPAFPRPLYELGRLEALSGRDDEARTFLERALTLAPDFLRARHALAEVHRRHGRADEAGVCFKQALALAPEDTESLRGLAFVRLAAGADREALYLFDRVAGQPPTPDPVQTEIIADAKARALVLRRAGTIAAAPDLTALPPSESSWASLADVPKDAAPVASQDPQAADALVEEAVGHFARREFIKALGALMRARRFDPDRADIAYREGVTHAALQDFPAAKRAWEEALALGGSRNLITRHLALVNAKLSPNGPAAVSDLRQAWLGGRLLDALVLASDEGDALGTQIEADVLVSLGMMSEALARYNELLGGYPNDRLAMAGRAEALKMDGQGALADAARLAYYAPGYDEGWENLFLFRRKELRRLVEASLAPAP